MFLGTLMQELQDETTSTETLLSLGDIVLIAEVDAARQPHDESTGEYLSGAVNRFTRLASDEDWLRLMTALEKSDRPAAACLSTMVRWSIERDSHAIFSQRTHVHAKAAKGAAMTNHKPDADKSKTHLTLDHSVIPFGLLDTPLEYIFADHGRQRAICLHSTAYRRRAPSKPRRSRQSCCIPDGRPCRASCR